MKAERKVRSGVSELFGATHFRQSNTSGRQLITSPQVLLSLCGSSACHSSTRDILRQQPSESRRNSAGPPRADGGRVRAATQSMQIGSILNLRARIVSVLTLSATSR